jgi:hypothetical protein
MVSMAMVSLGDMMFGGTSALAGVAEVEQAKPEARAPAELAPAELAPVDRGARAARLGPAAFLAASVVVWGVAGGAAMALASLVLEHGLGVTAILR